MIWFSGSIPEAIIEAKKKNNLFLVYIEGSDEMSKQMTDTYNDNRITQKLSEANVVALKLVANSQPYLQFSAIYPVLVIPSSYFIGRNGVAIEIITGGMSPDQFSTKLDQIFQVHDKSNESVPTNANDSAKEAVPAVTGPSGSDTNETSTSVASFNATALDEASTSNTSATEAAPVESPQALQERVERAKELMRLQQEKKAMEEKEKERKEEIERRNIGKAIQQAQQMKHENELKELTKTRAKEKEEERQAREKVRAMIAQDRAERAVRYQQTKQQEQVERDAQAKAIEEQERAARNAAMNSNEARLQFRLPDGSFTTSNFTADSTLEEARRFVVDVVRPPFSNFTLCTTFPRRHFTESNYAESLRDLQLAPSAVLLILPAASIVNVSRNTGFFTSLFWTLISPLTTLWRMITSVFPGSSRSPPPRATQREQSTERNNTVAADSHSTTRRREPNFSKREGNVFRINNQSDDDENNTWNGNSTQQM